MILARLIQLGFAFQRVVPVVSIPQERQKAVINEKEDSQSIGTGGEEPSGRVPLSTLIPVEEAVPEQLPQGELVPVHLIVLVLLLIG